MFLTLHKRINGQEKHEPFGCVEFLEPFGSERTPPTRQVTLIWLWSLHFRSATP